MLILTRRVGESIMIGDQIEIVVMGFNGNQIRVGIKAPKDISVDRAEVRERKEREQG